MWQGECLCTADISVTLSSESSVVPHQHLWRTVCFCTVWEIDNQLETIQSSTYMDVSLHLCMWRAYLHTHETYIQKWNVADLYDLWICLLTKMYLWLTALPNYLQTCTKERSIWVSQRSVILFQFPFRCFCWWLCCLKWPPRVVLCGVPENKAVGYLTEKTFVVDMPHWSWSSGAVGLEFNVNG